MKLTHIHMSFQDKVIFDDEIFESNPYMLTVIKGESGSGKTTLLNLLALEYFGFEEYLYSGSDIVKYEEEKRKQFYQANISLVKQDPILLDDLTIREHIQLIEEIFDIKEAYNKSKELHIDHLLDKYPLQLSGGEKTRVGLMLGMLKKPSILLLDEPTSSLDPQANDIIYHVLREYADGGNEVIISTHDEELIKRADYVYEIKGKHLVCDKKFLKKYDDSDIKMNTIKLDGISKYFRSMFKHHKFIKIGTILLSCISIALLSFSLNLNGEALKNNINYLNSLSSTELIVYKPTSGFTVKPYSDEGTEEPFTKEEYESLLSVSHIEKIKPRYDFAVNNSLNLAMNSANDFRKISADDNYYIRLSLYDGDKDYKSKDKFQLNVHTYSPDIDYLSKIEYQFNEQGIYISNFLAKQYCELLNKGNDLTILEGMEIEIPMLIPMYNFYGYAWLYYSDVYDTKEDDYTKYFMNQISGVQKTMKFKIAGILKGNQMCQIGGINNLNIFMSYDDFEKIREPYIVDDTRIVYFAKENAEFYFNEKPKGIELEDWTGLQTPWQPNGYTVIVDSLENLKGVIGEIQDLGFNVCNDYVNFEANVEYVNETANAQRGYSMVLGGILIAIYFGIKVMHRKEEKMINSYFDSLGLTIQDIKNIKNKKYFMNFMIVSFVSVIMVYVLFKLMAILGLGLSKLDFMMIIFIIGISFLIEFIIPKLIERTIR